MPILRYTILAVVYVFLAIDLKAQAYAHRFEQLDFPSTNLSTPSCIAQDSMGFIWIGSTSGLYRFDGYELKHWHNEPDQVNTLPNNYVRQIFIDKDDNVWLMHQPGGLTIYHAAQDTFIPVSIVSPNGYELSDIHEIIQDQAGQYWIAGKYGLSLIAEVDLSRGQLEADFFNKWSNGSDLGEIRDILIDETGKLWLGGSQGVGYYESSSKEMHELSLPTDASSQSCQTIFQSLDNDLIAIYDHQSHPWRLNMQTQAWRPVLELSLYASDIYDAVSDMQGNWWITEAGFGLHRYNPMSLEHEFFSTRDENSLAVKGDYIHSPYIDREGNLWLAGAFNLQMLRKTHKDIQNYELAYAGQSRISGIWSNDSIAVFGQIYGGIVLLDLSNGQHERLTTENSSLRDNRCSRIVPKSQDDLWICGREALYAFNPFTKDLELYAHRADDILRTMIIDSQNRHWLLWTAGDLMLLDPETKQTSILFPELGTEYGAREIRSGFADEDGYLWLSTINGGLIRLHPDRDEIHQFLADSLLDPGRQTARANYIYPTSDSSILIGTNGGLFEFNRRTLTFKRYLSEADGLSSDVVYGMLKSDEHTLWVLTNYGLNRVDLATHQIRNYYRSDGFQNDYYLNGKTTANGRLLLGGQSGLSIIKPDALLDHPVRPKVVIQNILVQNQALRFNQPIPYLDSIELSHRQNFLSFQLSSLHQQAPERNQYAYRLIGFQDEWVQLGYRRSFDITNLGPDHYTLEVKTANSDGIWQLTPKRLSIYIRPAFWQTTWFWCLIGLIFLATVYAIYSNRIQRFKREVQLNQRIKALEQQALHAQMNPHFLFNSLNSIKAYIGQSDTQKALLYLQEFSQLIRRTLQHGRSERVRLQDELELLRHYLNLEQFRFQPSFTYHIQIEEDVQSDFLEIPPMLIHPYVENAIWHGLMHKESVDRQLVIVIKRSGDWVIIQIEDNGIGRKMAAQLQTRTASKHQSLGMRITQDRLDNFPPFEEKSASVEIIDLSDQQGKASGTRVILQLPIPE
ncbi:MAG: histidine kinase [Bacteroidota bacterium]